MPSPTAKKLTFSILVEEIDNAHVAHCLETGLVAAAIDESDAVAKISKLLQRQVRFALDHDRLADIYHPAPREVFNKFVQMQERFVGRTQKPIKGNAQQAFMIDETAYAPAC
jgi:hypothetical protein